MLNLNKVMLMLLMCSPFSLILMVFVIMICFGLLALYPQCSPSSYTPSSSYNMVPLLLDESSAALSWRVGIDPLLDEEVDRSLLCRPGMELLSLEDSSFKNSYMLVIKAPAITPSTRCFHSIIL